jgi:hypothetical protein
VRRAWSLLLRRFCLKGPFYQTADVSAKTQTSCPNFPQSVWQRLIRPRRFIWGRRFQKRFRKKPKPKWMIKPMTKSFPMIRMSQDLAQVGPAINLSLA